MEVRFVCGGEELVADIPDRNVASVIIPEEPRGPEDQVGMVRRALENPIGSRRLRELVNRESKVALLIDGWKRPTLHHRILPAVAEELERGGVPDENVKMIVGLGVHRFATRGELEKKIGREFLERWELVQHNRSSRVRFMGITPTAANPVWINEEAARCDVKVAIGNIGFNVLTGFSGGAKMICPGIASYETINLNHRLDLSPLAEGADPDVNPVRRDCEEMAEIVGLDFIINAIHNTRGEMIHVVAGHYRKAHREGVEVARRLYGRKTLRKADIVVSNANPRYVVADNHAPIDDMCWAVLMVERGVKEGGTMILTHRSPWPEHPIVHKHCPFYRECEEAFLKARPDSQSVLLELCRGSLPCWIGTVIYATSKVMEEKEVVMVNKHCGEEDLAGSGWRHSQDLQEAIDQALKKHGPDARVIILPYGGRYTHLTSQD